MGLELLRDPEGQAAEEMKTWSAPRHAFVLFESRHFEVGQRKWYTSLFPLNAEHRPDVGSKFDQYIQKGFRVLGFGNFPRLNDRDGARASKAKLHSGPNQSNPWDELERRVRQYARMSVDADATKEVSALKAKLAAMEADKDNKKAKDENRGHKEASRS